MDTADRTPRLVLGAAKSGKSAYAEGLIAGFAPPHVYIATSQTLDDEMRERVREHRRRRGSTWETVESPMDLIGPLTALVGLGKATLVDCLTLWLTNLLLNPSSGSPEERVSELCDFLRVVDYPLILVSNEVGWGIVPDNPLGRRFRDLAGVANQRIAASCAAVTLVVAGIPMRLK